MKLPEDNELKGLTIRLVQACGMPQTFESQRWAFERFIRPAYERGLAMRQMNEPINQWPKSRPEARGQGLSSRLFNYLARRIIMAGETTVEQQIANTETAVLALPQTLATAISTAVAALPAPTVDLSSINTALAALQTAEQNNATALANLNATLVALSNTIGTLAPAQQAAPQPAAQPAAAPQPQQ